jgi:hypothetical protein
MEDSETSIVSNGSSSVGDTASITREDKSGSGAEMCFVADDFQMSETNRSLRERKRQSSERTR